MERASLPAFGVYFAAQRSVTTDSMDFVVVTLRVTLIHHAERDDYSFTSAGGFRSRHAPRDGDSSRGA